MSRLLVVVAVAAPLAHAALFACPGPAWARVAAAVMVDAAAAILVARQFRLTRRIELPASDEALPVPALAAEPAATPEPPVRDGEAAARETVLCSRLGEIGEIARSSLESGKALLEELSAVGRSGSELSELASALADARQGSTLLRENTDKIFEIANNLANSAEQAFNLAHDVEGRAATMAGDLASSLAETEDLLGESQRISDIIAIMSEISSTTNILSFNASIVAANAGAVGKPFAVVAKEMRKLSESTEASLRDITAILHTIQDKVKAVSDRIRSVNAGVKDEKESLVAVAGELQGVMLANEVVRTVSSLCAQKSAEELERLSSMASRADSAVRGLGVQAATASATGLAAGLQKVVGLAE